MAPLRLKTVFWIHATSMVLLELTWLAVGSDLIKGIMFHFVTVVIIMMAVSTGMMMLTMKELDHRKEELQNIQGAD